MLRRLLVLAVFVLAATASATPPIGGYSGSLTGFSSELLTIRSALDQAAQGGDPAAQAELVEVDAVRAIVEDPATTQTYLGEMKSAAAAAKAVVEKLKTETSLPPTLDPAALRYRYDLDLARTDLSTLVDSLSGAQRKKTLARLKKADKALAAAAKARTAGKPISVELGQLAKAAALLSPTYQDAALDVNGSPVSVAVDSTGRFVYVAQTGDTLEHGSFGGDVRQMQLFPDGSVSYLTPASVTAGLRPNGVVTSPKAPFAYVGNAGEATISQFAIQPDGRLVPLSPPTVTLPFGTGVDAISIDANGGFVFTIAFGNGGSPVTSWAIAADGTLSPVGTAYASDFPTSIWAGAIDPTAGGLVVTSSRYRNSSIQPRVTVFSVGPTGAISNFGGVEESSAFYAVALAPGAHVVGVHETGFGAPFQFSVFDIQANGSLVRKSKDRAAGNTAYSIGMSKTGVAYVGNLGDGSISVFGPGTVVRAPAPYGFAVTPDGKKLLVGNHLGRGAAANLVTVFGISGASLVGR